MADSKATMRLAALAGAVATGAAALAMTGWLGPSGPAAPDSVSDAPPVAAQAGAPAGQGASVALPAAAPGPTSEAAPDPVAAAPSAPSAEIASGAAAPRFDLVRVEPDGAALVAGRAAPGARVEARLDGETVGEAVADAAGQFVLFAEVAPGPAARELTLATRLPDRPETISVDSVLVLPRAGEASPPAEATAAPGPAPDAARTPVVPAALASAEAEPGPAAADAAERAAPGAPGGAEGPEAAAAPVLLRASSTGGVSVLDPQALGPASGVTLDAASYTARGEVHLAGRGRAGRTARIYADGRPQADAAIDDSGAWRATLAELTAPGRYTLRVDEIDSQGRVTSRIESPFLREPPDALAGEAPGRVVVQPGHSLWAIARARYGSGARFALVYSANRERIRDPDLIYPGQVFDLPSGEAAPPR